MKLVTVLSVLVGSLIIAGQVRAETMSTQLTREKTSDHFYAFTTKVERVKQKEAGELFEFQVKVEAKNAGDHPKEARLSSKLEVFNGKELISSCRVQSTGLDGELSFSFQVAAKYAEQSRFTYAEEGDGDSIYYWFHLKDFAELPLPRGNAPLAELAEKSKGALVATLLEIGDPEPGPPGAADYASKWKIEKVLRGTYPATANLSFRVQSIPEASRERPPVVGKKYILMSHEANANQVAAILDADETNLRNVQDLMKSSVESK